jgi:GxxExxY protein
VLISKGVEGLNSQKKRMSETEITYAIIGAAMKVHTNLGPGLLESVYKECLHFELQKSDLIIEREKAVPIIYETIKLDCGYRLDLLVQKKVVVEIKSVEGINDVYLAQLLTYLKLGNYRWGILLNFNVCKLTDGIRRVVNGFG